MSYRAVIFDLGGVVLPSPIEFFRTYERERGLPDQFISEVVVGGGEHGAWSRLERGELNLAEFAVAFGDECEAAGMRVDVNDLLGAMTGGGAPHPQMVTAIGAIRAHGLTTAALTNNWKHDDGASVTESNVLDGLFDVVVESAVEGLRKPDPRIYHLVCERLGIEPADAVFLDDLGVNLKSARMLGMTTIKVASTADALAELTATLGFPLTAA
ncbi:MAG: HAD-IA family hydrolase [Acidimicrobiia bacterium]